MDKPKQETDRYNKALELATRAHAGQVDKGGNAYINHPIAAAGLVEGEAKIVALLHDVVEDGHVDLSDLRSFGDQIVNAVDAITRRPGEARKDYLDRVASNPLAREVKIADLIHNSEIGRIQHPTVEDFERVERYRVEMQELMEGRQ